MEPERPNQHENLPHEAGGAEVPATAELSAPPEGSLTPAPEPFGWLRRIFIGAQGLRAGWSVLIFIISFLVLSGLFVFPLVKFNIIKSGIPSTFTAPRMLLGEGAQFLAVLGAAFVVALVERRKLVDFNLRGPRRPQHFLGGLAAGFVALSVLAGLLAIGGWMHVAGVALSGIAIVGNGLLWGGVFFLVGCTEEGMFRCYLQFTLTRGVNFWWALGLVALMCGSLALTHKGNGAWGVYAIAILGFFPCLFLHQVAEVRSDAFWQAAWVTSTLFGFVHTSNGGENWIGIFQAAFVGAIFCISIRLTGSVWWAIGAHTAWDWAQTFFYGTPDSGMVGQGHFLNSTLTGNVLWSGGADGPEGSVLGIGIMVLLLVWLLAAYGRRAVRQKVAQEQPAG